MKRKSRGILFVIIGTVVVGIGSVLVYFGIRDINFANKVIEQRNGNIGIVLDQKK